MHILILDDNEKELSIITELITKELNKHLSEFEVSSSISPSSLNLNKYYDVLFLDIDMPIDGIELAKIYLSNHKGTFIVFISNRVDRVFDTFNVHPYQFIRKNELTIHMPHTISSLVEQIGANNRYITIKTAQGYLDIACKKIIYIESQKHYCTLYTNTNKFTTRSKLTDIYKNLSNDFCHIHGSVIINWNYVSRFESNIIYIDDKQFIVSKSKRTKTKQSYLDYLRRSI